MSAHIKVRYKKHVIPILLALWLALPSNAQPTALLPELTMNHGLRHDVVRTVTQDSLGRTWVGTDAGLKVFFGQDPASNALVENLKGEAVHSIGFFKNFVLAGTLSSGLRIADLKKGTLIRNKAFDTLQFVRRIRVLGDTAYIAANHTAGYITLGANGPVWHSFKWQHLPSGHIIEFYRYLGKIFGIDHDNEMVPLFYAMKGDSLQKTAFPASIPPPKYFIYLTAEGDGEELRIGGDGLYATLNQNGRHQFTRIRDSLEGLPLAVWDMARVGKRQFLALGQPLRMRMGAAYEWGKSHPSDIRNDFYCKSLFYDHRNDVLWMGTYNRGLFIWPQISLTHHLPVRLPGKLKTIPLKDGGMLIHNEHHVYRSFDNDRPPVLISSPKNNPKFEDIIEVRHWQDTIGVLRASGFYMYDLKGKMLSKVDLNPLQFSHFNMMGNNIVFFSKYNTGIAIMDRKTGKLKPMNEASIEVRSRSYRNGLFYFSEEKGFSFLDSVAHPFTPSISKAEDFILVSDTLWILNDGRIFRYRVNLKTYTLKLLDELPFDQMMNGVVLTWIKNMGQAGVVAGNNKAMFKFNVKSMVPEWHRHLGNFSETDIPSSKGDTLFFVRQPWLAKVPASQPYNSDRLAATKVHFPSGTVLDEGKPLEIHFLHDDYFIRQHALKRVQLGYPDGHEENFYTLDSMFLMPQALPVGKYHVAVYVNGQKLGSWDVDVAIPLLRNPWFYALMTAIISVLLYFGFRQRSKQRDLERDMLENRLMLLKKNLDPHFIFNSLNLTYMLLIEKKYDEATQSIFKFSELHRYFLEMLGKKRIYLKEEWDFIRNYLDVEQMRAHMDAPFDVEITSLSPEMELLEIPPLILHPLVENAVKYCSPLQGNTAATLWIEVWMEGDQLVIAVENTSDGKGQSKSIGFGRGLSIVEETLQVSNRLGNKPIRLVRSTPLKHCSQGFRIELWFDDVIR